MAANASSAWDDWSWKLREAVDRIKNSYDHIGRGTGAPFLAIVYPPDAEASVDKEWNALLGSFGPEYQITSISILDLSSKVLEELGIENVIETMLDPMPGSNPETELGNLWLSEVVKTIQQATEEKLAGKQIIVLYQLAALYPATNPRSLMQALWDTSEVKLNGPVVIFIPGRLLEPRVYEFLNVQRELMYRGDIL